MMVLELLATISKSTSVYNLKEQKKLGYLISLFIRISHDKSKGTLRRCSAMLTFIRVLKFPFESLWSF